jgi:DNA/RNA endonuclease YhcR with UshA esterase domain
VTVQAAVKRLYYPHAPSQQQVAIIDDGTGKAKVTVWRSSLQDTIMQEGDTVRVTGGLAGWYAGQAQVSVDSDTRISIIERGDGPATRRSDGTVFGATYTPQ